MKSSLKPFAPIVRFIVIFFGVYIVATVVYMMYLELSKQGQFTPDFITYLVAKQTDAVLNTLGYQASVVPDAQLPLMQLYINDIYLAQIVEGCNAISVIILFVSFVFAFYQGFKKTLVFVLAGCVLIYTINILRIVFLAIALYKYPSYQEMLHGVLFPVVIYGFVCLLWLFWVKGINLKVNQDE